MMMWCIENIFYSILETARSKCYHLKVNNSPKSHPCAHVFGQTLNENTFQQNQLKVITNESINQAKEEDDEGVKLSFVLVLSLASFVTQQMRMLMALVAQKFAVCVCIFTSNCLRLPFAFNKI